LYLGVVFSYLAIVEQLVVIGDSAHSAGRVVALPWKWRDSRHKAVMFVLKKRD
jgi:hypothetical protein